MTDAANLVRDKGSVGCGVVVMRKIENAPDDREDWAALGISTTVESDDFATYSFLLIGDRECDEGDSANFVFGSIEKFEAPATNKQLDVIKVKGGSIRGRAGVFTRTEKEKKARETMSAMAIGPTRAVARATYITFCMTETRTGIRWSDGGSSLP